MKIFLGGTCNGSKWREELIPMLPCEYFNPVVESWTDECQQEEIRQRGICDYVLYVITPASAGSFGVAEAVEDAVKNPNKTLFMSSDVDPFVASGTLDFTEAQAKSMRAVKRLIERNGARTFDCFNDICTFLKSAQTPEND
jgi:hypothetical protein